MPHLATHKANLFWSSACFVDVKSKLTKVNAQPTATWTQPWTQVFKLNSDPSTQLTINLELKLSSHTQTHTQTHTHISINNSAVTHSPTHNSNSSSALHLLLLVYSASTRRQQPPGKTDDWVHDLHYLNHNNTDSRTQTLTEKQTLGMKQDKNRNTRFVSYILLLLKKKRMCLMVLANLFSRVPLCVCVGAGVRVWSVVSLCN